MVILFILQVSKIGERGLGVELDFWSEKFENQVGVCGGIFVG